MGTFIRPSRINYNLADASTLVPRRLTVLSFARDSSRSLCGVCRQITLHTLKSDKGHALALSRAELALSACTCPLCSLILSSYSLYPQFAPGGPAPITLFLSGDVRRQGQGGSVLKVCEGGKELFGDGSVRFDVRIQAVDRVLIEDRIIALEDFTNTLSAHSFEFAQSSLHNCLQWHKCSRQLSIFADEQEPQTWPSRIIELNSIDSTADPGTGIKLVDFLGLKSQLQYCALSYCWGASGLKGKYRTTMATLEERKQRIDFQGLPRSIQDAIRICRRLEIGYLWVDALCIIQDCEKDWQSESTKIGAIYAQSHVTIAAEASDSVDGGCFNDPEESLGAALQEHFEIHNTLPDGRQSRLYIYPRKPTSDYGRLDMGALGSRGWVCQERMFSPRILHYTRRQLFWECRQNFQGADNATSMGFSRNFSLLDLDVASPEIQLQRWYIDVIYGDYSARKLTFGSDKLPAISSLAKVFHRQIKSPYLAGLWLRDVEWGMSWACTGENAKPLCNGCPSWTWASIDSEVYWPPKPSSRPLCQVESVDVTNDSLDPFGTVGSGLIRIKGYTREGWVEKSALYQSKQSQLFLGRAWLDYSGEAQAVVYLQLFEESPSPPHRFYRVLLLIPCTQGSQTFRRIGVARINWDLSLSHFDDFPMQALTII